MRALCHFGLPVGPRPRASRPAQHRHAADRHHAASGGRAVQGHGRHRRADRALQRHAAGDHGRAWWRGGRDGGHPRRAHAADCRQGAAPPGRAGRPACAAFAPGAHRARKRRGARVVQRHVLERPGRTRPHAAGGGGAPGARGAGRAGAGRREAAPAGSEPACAGPHACTAFGTPGGRCASLERRDRPVPHSPAVGSLARGTGAACPSEAGPIRQAPVSCARGAASLAARQRTLRQCRETRCAPRSATAGFRHTWPPPFPSAPGCTTRCR